jgi:hypothetical protein
MSHNPLLLVVAVMAAYLFFCSAISTLMGSAEAVSLSISGHSSGTGYQNLTFAGNLLNVSILQNISWRGWNVSIMGASA